MPFIGINPPAARVNNLGPLSGASISLSPLSATVDLASLNISPGHIGFYRDSSGRISVLAYSVAQASIVYGAALQHQAGGSLTVVGTGLASIGGFDPNVVLTATTKNGGYPAAFAGIAGASVVNTGAGFWRYISGFVPEAAMGSTIGSGALLQVSASAAGFLATVANFGLATVAATIGIPVGFALGANGATAGAVNSVFLTGWYY